jgi:hypothetical protein
MVTGAAVTAMTIAIGIEAFSTSWWVFVIAAWVALNANRLDA